MKTLEEHRQDCIRNGKRLQEARLAANITYDMVEEATGIDQEAVDDLEAGKGTVSHLYPEGFSPD